jgi:predicted P-loop ATPase
MARIEFNANSPCPVCQGTNKGCSADPEKYPNGLLCHTYKDGEALIGGFYFIKNLDYCGLWTDRPPESQNGHHKKSPKNSSSPLVKKRIKPEGWNDYVYRDSDGNDLVRVKRQDRPNEEKKKIYQEFFDGKSWQRTKGDIDISGIQLYEPVKDDLFRLLLPQWGNKVFIVEGEYQVHALLDLGLLAVTSYNGSGQWSKYGSPNKSQLDGMDIVICPDGDRPGLKHADDIYADFPDAKWLYVPIEGLDWSNAPSKGGVDIWDWIHDLREQGLSDEQIKEKILSSVESKRSDSNGDGSDSDDDEADKAIRDRGKLRDKLGNRLRMNTLTQIPELDGVKVDGKNAKIQLSLDYGIKLKSSKEDVEYILNRVARENSYHPFEEYFLKIEASDDRGLSNVFDGLAHRLFGVSDPVFEAMLKRFLIASVARVLEPGCKHDSVLILKGGQGVGKSTFFRALFGANFFNDTLPSQNDKDFYQALNRSVCCEWAELEVVFSRKDVSVIKNILSSQQDCYRPLYERFEETFPRRSVIVGTTNEDAFLTDPTGSRRFWVIPVIQAIPIEWVLEQRDLIWGAAIALYRAGEQWHLTDIELAASETNNKAYQSTDPWQLAIEEYLLTAPITDNLTVHAVLDSILKVPVERRTKRDEMRVTNILKGMGWIKKRNRFNGKDTTVWKKPNFDNLLSKVSPGIPEGDESNTLTDF